MSEKQRPLFVVLDGNSLLHRAWHAVPPLTTRDGVMVNAVFGFATVLEKLLDKYKPDYFVVAWDLPGGTFRHEEYALYKAQREKKADELYEQIPMIQELLLGYGVPSLSVPGFEADDIVATLATQNAKKGEVQTVILTGDLDSLQLVQPGVVVDVFVKGLSEVKRYDEAAVVERYGLRPDQLIHYKALRGDSSDNLPGVVGIGEKTAVEILRAHGDTKGVLEALSGGAMSEKHQKKLRGHEAELQQMLRLVTSVLDVPLAATEEELRYSGPESDKLIKLYRDFEFTRFLKKYETLAGIKAGAPVVASQPLETQLKLKELELRAKVSELGSTEVFILLKAGAPSLFGPGVEWLLIGDREGYVKYVHPTAEEVDIVREKLAGAEVLVGHDLKAVRHAVQFENNEAINLDVMVMAYLLNPGGRGLSFREIAKDTLNIDISEDEGEKMLSALPELVNKLEAELKRDEMFDLYQKMDAPLIPILYKMESLGVLVDRKRLEGLQQKFASMIEGLTADITVLAGRSFNINSPSQLAEVLFETLGLPTKGLKKTKSGYSTAATELEKLWEEHPIIAKISEYREVSKLKSTYADTLPALIKADGRIHTSLNQCVAATGRLSSSDPNLQNIPIRTELGREIRSAFVAPPGKLLLSIDYSQIELRLAAAMANDEAFLRAFAEGVDIHTQTAAEIWGVSLDQVSKTQRSAAKAINFSILYGVGPRALARATGSTFEEAKLYIEKYFKAHEAIRDYMDAQKIQAKTVGYVATWYGRRRYLPEIESAMPQVRAQAERMAINMPIQGTEADILKLAMLEVERVIKAEKLPVKLLLQVHDELLFEVEEAQAASVAERLAKVMSGVVSMKVDFLVDTALSPDWGTME